MFAWWIFLSNSLDELSRYPGIPLVRARERREVALLAGVILFGGLAGIIANILVSPRLN